MKLKACICLLMLLLCTGDTMLTQFADNAKDRLKQVVEASLQVWGNTAQARLAATQAVLESGLLGKVSSLAASHNNLFGIKGSGTAGSARLKTREVFDGKDVFIMAPFAKNKTIADSFIQHKKLLNNKRYKKVMAATSFEHAAAEVRLAGYATDPKYPQKLVDTYNKYLKELF